MITILFLSANPRDISQLEVIKECNEINKKIRSSPGREIFKLEQRHAISIKSLTEELLHYKPEIIHFSGHGSKKNALIFEDEFKNAKEVPPLALSNIFRILGKNKAIRLVFLNACFTRKQANAIAKHIDVVIGMSTEVLDSTAIEFASSFYSYLGFGKSIQDAFDLAIGQLRLLLVSEYHIPKLIVKKGVDVNVNPFEKKISTDDNDGPNGKNFKKFDIDFHKVEGGKFYFK